MVWAPDDPTPPWLQQLPSDPFAQAPVETQYAPDGTPPDAPPSPPVAAPEVAAPPASPAVIASGAAAPAPDAISGAAEGIGAHAQYLNNIGPVHFDPYGQSPEQDAQQRSTDLIAMAPEDRADTIATGDPSKLASAASANMTPEELAAINIRHEQAAMHQQAADALDMSRRNQVEAEQNYKAYVAAQQKAAADTAQVQADAQRIAGTKISATPGIGLALAGVISSALVGGLQRSGTPNGALQSFQKAIDDHIQEQKDNLANQWQGVNARKSAITDELAQHGDLFRAQETFRIAAYDRALGDLKTKAQDYDPQGTTALRIAQTTQQFQAARAQALEAVNAARQKQQLELFEAQRKQAADAETARHNKAGEGVEWARVGLEKDKNAAAKAGSQVFSSQELAALHPGMPVPPVGMSLKDYGGWLERGDKGAELKNKQLEASTDERARSLGVGDIVDDKGNHVLFRTPEVAQKVADSKAAVDTGTGIIDRLVAARKKYGWTSDLMKSDEWRQMNADYQELVLQKKNIDQLGAISETDMKLVGGALGTKDITEARDPTAGLKAARNNMVNGFNAKVRTAIPPGGAKPKRYDPPQLSDLPETSPLVPGKTSVEQGEGARLGLAGQALSFTSNDERAAKAENQGPITPTGLAPEDDARVAATIHDAAKGNADAIQRLADAASSGREAVTNAVLARVRAESPEVFAQVLDRLPPEIRQQQEAMTKGIPQVVLPRGK